MYIQSIARHSSQVNNFLAEIHPIINHPLRNIQILKMPNSAKIPTVYKRITSKQTEIAPTAKEGSRQVHLAPKIDELLPSEWKKLNAKTDPGLGDDTAKVVRVT